MEGEAPAENGLAELSMKGGGSLGTIKALTEVGKHHERRGETLRAKAAYREALNVMAGPMNNLATLYLQDRRAEEANRLAAMAAVQLLPGEPTFLHTYAASLNVLGEIEQAIQFMEKAACLNPKYAKDLRVLRNQAAKQ